MKTRLQLSLLALGFSFSSFSQQWHKIGTGIGYYSGGPVGAFKVINDSLYVGGTFGGGIYGGKGNAIIKFDGVSDFDSLGDGIDGPVTSIEYYNGEIYAGGANSGAGLWPYIPGTKNFAKWNGSQWDSVPGHFGGIVQSLKYNSSLLIGGDYVYNNYHFISQFNGTAPWDDMKGGVNGWPGGLYAMAIYKGDLIVAGGFQNAQGGTVQANGIARWDGSNWHSLGSGLNDMGRELAVDTVNDVLYVGGSFTTAGGISSKYIAKWDGTNWSAVPDFPDTCGPVGNFKIFDGKLYAGAGYCSSPNPVDTYLVALDLNTNTWSAIFGPTDIVWGLEVFDGNLWVGGSFRKIDTVVVNQIACYGDSCPGTPINLTLPYGVNDQTQPAVRFKVYPNPSKGNITVETEENMNFRIRITKSTGHPVIRTTFRKSIAVDISKSGKGLYLVEICYERGEKCHSQKVLIE